MRKRRNVLIESEREFSQKKQDISRTEETGNTQKMDKFNESYWDAHRLFPNVCFHYEMKENTKSIG